MTKDEFLPTISQNAQDIVNQNLQKFSKLSFEVFYSDESKVVSDNSSHYIIYVKNDFPDDTEYRFLHEFFHCIQYEEGFPSIVKYDEKYKELATYLSSIILDLDVRDRLEANGYFQDIKYMKKLIKMYIKILKSLYQFHNKHELTSIEDMIELAGLIITSDIAKVDNTELISIVKRVRPETITYYQIFDECIDKYSYNDAKDVEKIFEILEVVRYHFLLIPNWYSGSGKTNGFEILFDFLFHPLCNRFS